MKVLIVADIHGNATALRAVLKDAGDVDALWCVGDIVGYGPDPAECIGVVREIPNVCIAGNHDVGVAGNIGGAGSQSSGAAGSTGGVDGACNQGVGEVGTAGNQDAGSGGVVSGADSSGNAFDVRDVGSTRSTDSVRDACSTGDVGDTGGIGTSEDADGIVGAGSAGKAGFAGGADGAGDVCGAGNTGFNESADDAENAGDAVGQNVAGGISAGSFNSEARIARDWTRSVLTEDEILFLAKLPLMAEPLPGILLAHGAPVAGISVFRVYRAGESTPGLFNSDEPVSSGPGSDVSGLDKDASDGPISSELGSNALLSSEHDYNLSIYDKDTNKAAQADICAHENTPPQGKEQDLKKVSNNNLGIWEYVTSSWQAEEIFSMSQHGFSQDLFIVGHTHVPLAFVKGDGAGVEYVPLETGDIIELDFASFKYLLNPGSVGQPRDGDPRASFMLYDTEANVIEYRRVEYDVAEVMDRVDSVDLPHNLGARLEIGL
jgi:predicted phosphodiesterase